MTRLDTSALPRFTAWLDPAESPVLSCALVKKTLSFSAAAADGAILPESFDLDLEDADITRQAFAVLSGSGRKVWAPRTRFRVKNDSGFWSDVFENTAARIARITKHPVIDLAWLWDASTLLHTLCPEVTGRAVSEANREAFRDEMGAALNADAAARSAATASTVASLQRGFSPAARGIAVFSAKQEARTRQRLARGWRVDTGMLAAEQAKADEAKQRLAAEYGIDLVTSDTEADRSRIHSWLMAHGIRVADRHGRPTLARDFFDQVDTTALSDDGREAWAKFRAARSVYSRRAKLDEIDRFTYRGREGARVYTDLQLRATISGRATSTRPALQNLHGDLRPLLVADPGSVLVSLDLSNVEVRVAAAVSGDKALQADISAGDVYVAFAKRIWPGVDIDAVRRKQAKTAMLGVLYGSGAATLADQLGDAVSIADAKQLVNAFWRSYDGLRNFRNLLIRQSKEPGGIQPYPTGRPCAISPAGTHAQANLYIQGSGSDVLLTRQDAVLAELGDTAFWLSIHDELVLEVPESDAQRAVQVLDEKMNADFDGVFIGGEAQILGTAWHK